MMAMAWLRNMPKTCPFRTGHSSAPIPSEAQVRSCIRFLRDTNFRLLVLGLLISATGTWVQRIAQGWLVLTHSNSATAVGITTLCQLLP
jgi:hypothetical protein